MKWQPIETAPKDGTAVLVHEAGWDTVIAEWDASKNRWRILFTISGVMSPTHWMPLPEPPQEGE